MTFTPYLIFIILKKWARNNTYSFLTEQSNTGNVGVAPAPLHPRLEVGSSL